MNISEKLQQIYRRYDKKMKSLGSLDIGGSHHLTCQSMVDIFSHIQDLYNLEDIKTIDIGSGAGYFVFISHQLGAYSYGIEIESQHHLLIPHDLYDNNKLYKMINTDFTMTNISHYTSYDIVFLIIGLIPYIISLWDLFKNSYRMKAFVFLKPSKGFKASWLEIKRVCDIYGWKYVFFKVRIAVSHEHRVVIVIRKSRKVDFIDLSRSKRVRFNL